MKESNPQAVKHFFFSLSNIAFGSFSQSDCKDTTFVNIQKARSLFLVLFFSCPAKLAIPGQPAIPLVYRIGKSSPLNNLRRLSLNPSGANNPILYTSGLQQKA
ncbi:hypothetical protein [Phaeodactylibacter xiamenensis]|uniref:hypothetical protein n=1 Tax=Phaeodactylibacter xiamenensis TaxID=1524460 RepID=UPI003BAD9C8D